MLSRWAAVFLMIAMSSNAVLGAENLKTIQASSILEDIALGMPVKHDHVLVKGNLDLGDLNLPRNNYGKTIVIAPLSLTGSTIEGDLNLSNSAFEGLVDLRGTRIRGDASFCRSAFSESAIFSRAEFARNASFFGSIFEGDVDFSNSKFGEDCNISNVEFDSYAYFQDVDFGRDACLGWSLFKGYTYFDGSQFWGDASFFSDQFKEETHFDGVHFSKVANFSESRFGDYAYFPGSRFDGILQINKTRMYTWIIGWSAINGHLAYNPAAYLALVDNFNDIGYFDDSDECYYQFRLEKQSRETDPASRAADMLALVTCGYGVRPGHTLGLTAIVILLFGSLYWAYRAIPAQPDSEGHGSKGRSEASRFLNSLYFSGLSFFTTDASREWKPSGRWRYVVLAEHIAGWLLLALFLVTLSKVVIS